MVKLILLDEPTAADNPVLIGELMEHIAEIHGCGIILVWSTI